MTKALSSYASESERKAAIARRTNSKNSGGLGYWAAMDALAKMAKDKPKATEQVVTTQEEGEN